jgi:hypothetical protein
MDAFYLEAIPIVHVLAITQLLGIIVIIMVAIIVLLIARLIMGGRHFIIHVVMAVRYREVRRIVIAITQVRIERRVLMAAMVQRDGIAIMVRVQREV